MRLLLVEDDELLGDAVKTGLSQLDYVVDWLKDGEAARSALKTESFELIILDLGLPKLSGLNLLQSLRSNGNTTPLCFSVVHFISFLPPYSLFII